MAQKVFSTDLVPSLKAYDAQRISPQDLRPGISRYCSLHRRESRHRGSWMTDHHEYFQGMSASDFWRNM